MENEGFTVNEYTEDGISLFSRPLLWTKLLHFSAINTTTKLTHMLQTYARPFYNFNKEDQTKLFSTAS